MKTRTIAFVMVLALVVATSLVVAAQGPRRGQPFAQPAPGGPGGPGAYFARGPIAKQLNLTPDQVTQLTAIRDDFLAATKTAREDLQAGMEEMLQLWSAEQPDAVAVKTLAARQDAIRATIREACIDRAIAALGVLTPAQREQLRTMVKNRPGCGMMLGCGLGMGGPACGMGMGARGGMGIGPGGGPQDGTGPRARMGICPMTK